MTVMHEFEQQAEDEVLGFSPGMKLTVGGMEYISHYGHARWDTCGDELVAGVEVGFHVVPVWKEFGGVWTELEYGVLSFVAGDR